MKKVIWTYKQTEYWWSEMEFKVMYSYLFRFEKANKLDFLDDRPLVLKKELLLALKSYIDLLVQDLLTELYIEPSHKQLSKHASSYEKIEINNQVYRVNYRISDPVGFVAYSMFVFSQTLLEAFNQDEKIVIKFQ